MDTQQWIELARQAVELMQPAALAAGATAGKAVVTEESKQLWSWIKSNLSRPMEQGAILAIEEAPEDLERWDDFHATLVRALQRDPALREEFLTLLPADLRPSIAQTITNTGDGNAIAQIAGDGNQVHLSGR